ncbi:hypothetical protein C1I63_09995 [Rathayibacter caricis DSM 15933]|uniref:Uncharacterized protein n=1 Tax=Rathayibacter caricis DSM 15933 TaxID=1328867 RepID=A0A2T4UUD6_9MICO|nr:hypothetical protein [Rathayibacter caricis]PTL73150.1 hypothetical protein C1I63_09995 [Rathayibacter caricis DSM 15933]
MLESLIDAFTDPGAVDPAAAAMLVRRCRALLDADASDGRIRGTAFDGRLTVIEDTSSPEQPLWERLL